MPMSINGKVSHLAVTLFMCGDVMTGRGIDQVLPHPSDPRIFEGYMKDARGYVEIAEEKNGPIPRPVDFAYIWGDALAELQRVAPELRLINLETAVTRSGGYWPGKGINYRMSPENFPCITAARIDVCTLANNHILDWGYEGLTETLETLRKTGVKFAGAGRNLQEAVAPAVLDVRENSRVFVFAFGSETSGVPSSWAATEERPGVNLLPDLSERSVRQIREMVRAVKRPGDLVVVSIHWGGNWGYEIPAGQREFAHRLIDEAGVDLVHGHSSHHAKAIEVHHGKLILYGCGDFLNDYEGISGYEAYRDDLALMYFASLDPESGKLLRLRITPMQIRNFRLNRASPADARWLRDVLSREGKKFGTRVDLNEDGTLALQWEGGMQE